MVTSRRIITCWVNSTNITSSPKYTGSATRSNPTLEKTNVSVSFTLIEKTPLTFVIVPYNVPFNLTDTLGMAFNVIESTTMPFSVFCPEAEKQIAEEKSVTRKNFSLINFAIYFQERILLKKVFKWLNFYWPVDHK